MKKFTFTLLAAALVAGCNVNEDFDLSKIESDNLTFGNENSLFEAPMVSITIDLDEQFSSTTESLSTRASSDKSFADYVSEYDELIPSSYSQDGVDLQLLADQEDSSYRDTFIEELVTEAVTDEGKSETLASLVYDNWDSLDEIDPEIKDVLTESEIDYTADKDAFVGAFSTTLQSEDSTLASAITTTASALVQQNISELTDEIQAQDISASIDAIALPDDILKMITDNLDGENCSLRLFARIVNNIPFDFSLNTPTIEAISGYVLTMEDNLENDRLESNEISSDNLTEILEGINVVTTLSITTFYPSSSTKSETETEQSEGYSITIELGLIKSGAITL
ncbi:MAG: membrane lipoprotein lipid attachment site-containing protein [Rikenellaceae bacterium]